MSQQAISEKSCVSSPSNHILGPELTSDFPCSGKIHRVKMVSLVSELGS
jgi:hypothetical protein